MKNLLAFTVIFIIISIIDCSKPEIFTDNQGKKSSQNKIESHVGNDLQVSTLNPFFNTSMRIEFKGDFTFSDSRETENVNVNCEFLGNSEYGDLYHIVFDQIDRAEIPEKLLDLGYFYVEKKKIYRLQELSEEEIKTLLESGEILKDAVIVCQNKEVKDKNKDKGWHEKITIKGGIVEYSSYDDSSTTNFYETFVWKEGAGIILYRRGYGAELEAITLWQEEWIDNPHDFNLIRPLKKSSKDQKEQ